MFTRIRNTLRMIWRQGYASTIALLPIVDAAEKTKSSWARPIKSYGAVPEAYKGFFERFKTEGGAFPYAVLTPSYEGFLHKTTEKLICDLDRGIYILERSGDTFEARCYPLEGIHRVEVRTVLLDSNIKIWGMTSRGVSGSTAIKFNSITDYLLTPILQRIRLAAVDSEEAPSAGEPVTFEQWVRLNYKFMNYARRSLLAGERFVQAILQPEIRVGVVTLFGKTYRRTISPTHVCILTDRELILIREEIRPGGADRYGGIWDYIPLNKIGKLSVSDKDKDTLALTIQLPDKINLELIYQASARGELQQLLDHFAAMTAPCSTG